MATATQLERIAALVDKVTPLGNKQRGMPIEADDWNTLVSVLTGILEIDHTQETGGSQVLATRFAAIDHDHLGEVTSEWLAADLQGSFGGLGIEARRTLAEMNERIAVLSAEVARLSELVKGQQSVVDRVQVVNLDHTRKIRSFDDRFSTVDTLRTQVEGLGTQVIDMSKNVDVVLETRQILTDPTGKPIDLFALTKEISNLQEVSENLRGVSGEFVRLRDVEVRLSQLETVSDVGGGFDLDTRIGEVVGLAEERLASRFETQINTQVDSKVAEHAGQLRGDLEASNLTQFESLRGELRTDLEARSDAQIAAAEGRLDTRLNDALATNREQLRGELLLETQQAIDAGVGEAESRLNERMAGELAAGLDRVQVDVLAAATAEVNSRVGDLSAGLDQRITAVETGLDTLGNQTLPQRIEEVLGLVDERVDAGVNDALGDLDQRVNRVVTRGLERGTFNDQLGRIIDERMGNQPLPRDMVLDLVDEVLAEREGVLRDELRGEMARTIEGLRAEQQAEVSRLVNDLGALRGEVDSGRNALREEISLQVKSEVSTLRSEVNKTIDDRLVLRPFRPNQ